jgi:pSer/pThr/pTyr-binding forkhead associated (FHA) protein
MSFTVEIQHADRPAETLEFEQPVVGVGRDQGEVTVADPQLSGRHAELRFDGEAVQFLDLTSTNGSFDQDGQRLEVPTSLQLGQRVRLGENTWVELKSITPSTTLPSNTAAATTKLVLHLRELRCIKQQEIGGDEPYLFIRKNKVWSCDHMESGTTIPLLSIKPTSFVEHIDVALMEKDMFDDDRLGSGTATIDDLGKGVINFDWTEAGCHYQLLYEVTAADAG